MSTFFSKLSIILEFEMKNWSQIVFTSDESRRRPNGRLDRRTRVVCQLLVEKLAASGGRFGSQLVEHFHRGIGEND